MKIEIDSFVTINYCIAEKDGVAITDDQQKVIASFIYGRDRILPALEKNLTGHEENDEIELIIPPEQAFGQYDPSLVSEIPISQLKFPERLEAGQLYEEMDASGRPVSFTVKEISGDSVVADFNHPGAGKAFILQAKILEVRPASSQEILSKISQSMCQGGG